MTCCSISFFDTSIGIVQYCSSDDDCDGGVKMMIDGDGGNNSVTGGDSSNTYDVRICCSWHQMR